MSATKHSHTGKAKHAELAAQLRAAAELLEQAAANREVLGQLSQESARACSRRRAIFTARMCGPAGVW